MYFVLNANFASTASVSASGTRSNDRHNAFRLNKLLRQCNILLLLCRVLYGLLRLLASVSKICLSHSFISISALLCLDFISDGNDYLLGLIRGNDIVLLCNSAELVRIKIRGFSYSTALISVTQQFSRLNTSALFSLRTRTFFVATIACFVFGTRLELELGLVSSLKTSSSFSTSSCKSVLSLTFYYERTSVSMLLRLNLAS